MSALEWIHLALSVAPAASVPVPLPAAQTLAADSWPGLACLLSSPRSLLPGARHAPGPQPSRQTVMLLGIVLLLLPLAAQLEHTPASAPVTPQLLHSTPLAPGCGFPGRRSHLCMWSPLLLSCQLCLRERNTSTGASCPTLQGEGSWHTQSHSST